VIMNGVICAGLVVVCLAINRFRAISGLLTFA
jgi:hypothetical protein